MPVTDCPPEGTGEFHRLFARVCLRELSLFIGRQFRNAVCSGQFPFSSFGSGQESDAIPNVKMFGRSDFGRVSEPSSAIPEINSRIVHKDVARRSRGQRADRNNHPRKEVGQRAEMIEIGQLRTPRKMAHKIENPDLRKIRRSGLIGLGTQADCLGPSGGKIKYWLLVPKTDKTPTASNGG